MLLWLCTVCKFAASKHRPWARRTKRRFQRFYKSHFSLSVYRRVNERWKSNSDTLRIDIEIVVPVTALAVIVMDTFDWRPPKRSFWNGEKIVGGRVWLITAVMNMLLSVPFLQLTVMFRWWIRQNRCSRVISFPFVQWGPLIRICETSAMVKPRN